MSNNVITPEDKGEVLRELTIGDLSISEDGKINGYINKDIRENIDFDELMEESDRVIGRATISFEKERDGFNYPLD